MNHNLKKRFHTIQHLFTKKNKTNINSKSIDTQGSYETMKHNDKVRKGKLQTWSKLLHLKQVYMFPCVIHTWHAQTAFARDAVI